MIAMEASGKSLLVPFIAMASSAVGTLVFGIGYFVFLTHFDNKPPFTNTYAYTTNAAGEQQTTFRAGDVMLVNRDFCATRDVSLTFTRSLRRLGDNLYIHINTTTGALKKGCVDGPNFLKVPQAPPGVYQFVNTVTFSNNSLAPDQSVELLAPTIEIIK